jgi:hypothetical protein
VSRVSEAQAVLADTGVEQAQAVAEDDRDDRERQVVDQASGEELPDHVAAVDVRAAGQGREIGDRAGKEFLAVPGDRGAVGQHDHALARVGPLREAERGVVGAAAHDERRGRASRCRRRGARCSRRGWWR